MKNHKHQGFTIVELLIVVVIIAILAAITIVSYNGITKQAEDAKLSSSVVNWTKTFNLYKSKTGSLPQVSSNPNVNEAWCIGATYEANSDFPLDKCYSYKDPSNGLDTDGGFTYSAAFNDRLKSVISTIPQEKIKPITVTIGTATLKVRGLLYNGNGNTGRISYIIKETDKCSQGVKDTANAFGGFVNCEIFIN